MCIAHIKGGLCRNKKKKFTSLCVANHAWRLVYKLKSRLNQLPPLPTPTSGQFNQIHRKSIWNVIIKDLRYHWKKSLNALLL